MVKALTRWLPLIALGAGFGLRLYHLGRQSIWYDEGVSLYLARQTVVNLIQHTAGDIHPPLYYILLHFWLRLAGDSEFSAAFMSVFWGLLLVALVYPIGTRLCDRKVGLVASLCVALSPYNLWYSQEVRMYTLGAFWGWAAFWGAWCFLESREANKSHSVANIWLAVYVIASALGLYTLYYFAFLLVIFNVSALWQFLHRRKDGSRGPGSVIVRWGLAQLAILVLYSPWLGVAIRQMVNPPVPPWRSPTPLASILIESWSALSFGQSVRPGQIGWALLVTAALYGLGIWLICRRGVLQGAALALYTLGSVALIVLVSLWTPLFHVRYVFTYSPAFYLVLAAGWVWLVRRLPVAGWLVSATCLAVMGYSFYEFHYDPRYASDDFRGAVQRMAEGIRQGDAVLINAGYAYPPFVYYYPDNISWRGRLVDYEPGSVSSQAANKEIAVLQTGSIKGASGLGWGRPDSDFYPTDEAQTAVALARVFAAHPRVWVLRAYDTVVDPTGFIRRWLDEHGRQFEDRVFTGESYIRVQGYLTRREPRFEVPQLSKALNLTFGNDLQLLGYADQPGTVTAGRKWETDLYWRARRRLPEDYRVVVEMLDVAGRPWARDDEMPLGNAYPTSQWLEGEVLGQPVALRVPPGVPAGSYVVRLTVYDPKRQEALGAADSQGQPQGGAVELGKLSVTG